MKNFLAVLLLLIVFGLVGRSCKEYREKKELYEYCKSTAYDEAIGPAKAKAQYFFIISGNTKRLSTAGWVLISSGLLIVTGLFYLLRKVLQKAIKAFRVAIKAKREKLFIRKHSPDTNINGMALDELQLISKQIENEQQIKCQNCSLMGAKELKNKDLAEAGEKSVQFQQLLNQLSSLKAKHSFKTQQYEI